MDISEFMNLSQFMDTKSITMQGSAEVFLLKGDPQTLSDFRITEAE